MKSNAKQLQDELTALFKDATDESEARTRATSNPNMDPATEKAFSDIETSIVKILNSTLSDDDPHVYPDDTFMELLRTTLAYRPFITYPSWHVRTDVSEAELLAAEKDIRARHLAKLEKLRDQEIKSDFSMPIDKNFNRYIRLLNNLCYLAFVLACSAKHYNSFDAAKSFLRMISLVKFRQTRMVPNFKAEDIDNFINLLDSGVSELKIAEDYASLPDDWNAFCEDETKKIAEALKPVDAKKTKGKK